MFESLRSDLRLLSLLRRAVIAWETMARIMKARWDEERIEKEKRKPKPAEFGTLDIAEANRNWKLAQAGKLIDEDDEE
jgi:hypothetical protein